MYLRINTNVTCFFIQFIWKCSLLRKKLLMYMTMQVRGPHTLLNLILLHICFSLRISHGQEFITRSILHELRYIFDIILVSSVRDPKISVGCDFLSCSICLFLHTHFFCLELIFKQKL